MLTSKFPNLRVAILVNTHRSASFEQSTRSSFIETLAAVAPLAKVDFFDPIEAHDYPIAQSYDAIILSGGTADIITPEPWVLKLLEFVRQTVASSKTKLVGICWGHQAINVALGGRIAEMEERGEKPELGIRTVQLTEEGAAFFPFTDGEKAFDMHQFHRLEVVEPAPGLIPLVNHNQSFKSADNRILTFQGHPEMNAKLAQAILAEAPTYTKGMTETDLEEVRADMERREDGSLVFERIVAWVEEA
ncbi:copper/iron-regulated glutamine amidotransferase [Saccharata proteae CBS 121410]|uniref:Copper/iron-regulated glutamine amidotransferase n=1 Tax=Saccharata proteae CBS 121410 TaxID=1314787 RepID=A0A9P4HRQ1_9PEZI|nr:copper/iron-regulated glutamine amidotransferase [Saccharata proteae CBS 121410]